MCAFLGEQMGSEPTLPILSPELTGQRLLVGANFASAGIGILNDTGIQFVSPTLNENLSTTSFRLYLYKFFHHFLRTHF